MLIKKKLYFYLLQKLNLVRLIIGVFGIFVIAVSFSSCNNRGFKNISQGEIHYSIEYIGNTGVIPREVMPQNLIVSFKENKILFDISAPIGNSGIMNLSNPKAEIFDTYINFLGLRYFYSAQPGEEHPGFDAMEGMEMKNSSKRKVISGYECKCVEVTLPSNREQIYEVWYTDEINVENPNMSTPFSEIDGVLLGFFFRMGPSEMHFMAESVYKKEIPDKVFERREKYIRVSRDDISKFLIKMIGG